jgi:hypothetical protein
MPLTRFQTLSTDYRRSGRGSGLQTASPFVNIPYLIVEESVNSLFFGDAIDPAIAGETSISWVWWILAGGDDGEGIGF